MAALNHASPTGASDEEKIGHQVGDNVSPLLRDPDVVDWEGPDDPMNPMNWPFEKKVAATTTIALITILTYDWSLPSVFLYLVPR